MLIGLLFFLGLILGLIAAQLVCRKQLSQINTTQQKILKELTILNKKYAPPVGDNSTDQCEETT